MGKEWKERLKPHSYSDYVRVGPLLVYRWLWVLLLTLLLGGITVAAAFSLSAQKKPVGASPTDAGSAGAVEAMADVPALRWNDEGLSKLSGMVQILDGANVVRYLGEVREGACSGQGTVFDKNGIPVYVGMLSENRYEGEGALLAPDGTVLYEGDFTANLPNGQGVLFEPETGLVSEGDFAEGAFTGKGSQSKDRVLLREGMFQAGLLSGKGKELQANGTLLREGGFEEGLLSGAGVDCAPDDETAAAVAAAFNALEAESSLETGKGGSGQASGGNVGSGGTAGTGGSSTSGGSDGTGAKPGVPGGGTGNGGSGDDAGTGGSSTPGGSDGAASADRKPKGTLPQTGLRLEGSFEQGKLEGAGRAYLDNMLIYDGAFHDGKFQGDGTLRDSKTGRIRYTGNFHEGLPAGSGQLYDERGKYYYSGAMYQGKMDLLSFLGTSLAQVEAAFQTHFQIYACEDRTAFVYPELGLAFLTDSKVELLDPSVSSEEEPPPPPVLEEGEEGGAEESEEDSLLENQMLSENTRPEEIIITQLLITGEAEYPGMDGKPLYRTEDSASPGAVDFFGMHMLGLGQEGYEQLRSSEFVTLFAPMKEEQPEEGAEAAEEMAEGAENTQNESRPEGEAEKEPPVILRETTLLNGLQVEACTVNDRRYCLVSRYQL